MAHASDHDGTGAPRTRWPLGLLVVAVVAVAGFLGGYLLLGDDDPAGTAREASAPADRTQEESDDQPAPAYDVTVEADPDPPAVEGTVFTVTVAHDGDPVTDARVRITMDMDQHAHEGVSAEGEEVEPGTYEVPMRFVMRGTWSGRVLIDAPGEAQARESISYDVR